MKPINIYLFFIIISSSILLSSGSRIYKRIDQLNDEIDDDNSTKIWIQNACENYEKVVGINSITFPPGYQSINRPWKHQGRKIKLYTSETLTYNWNWFKEHKIKSLNTTLAELMTFFDKNGCLFVPYGEGVKNIFLGTIKETSPLVIEGETTCDTFKIYELCRQKFNLHLCGVKPTKEYHRVTLGVQDDNERFLQSMLDPIVIYPWNSTFNRPKTQWEFTANSVGIYDNTAGKIYLIEMHGRGLNDACRHFIEFPVKEEKWDKWVSGNLVKLLRYYNLQAEAFYARRNVREFVLFETRKLFSRKAFQEYYCRYVLRGFFASKGNISECRVISLDSRKYRLQKILNDTIKYDFGPFWDREMRPSIEAMEVRDATILDFHEGHHHRQVYSWPNIKPSQAVSEDKSSEDDGNDFTGDFLINQHNPDIWSIFNEQESENYSIIKHGKNIIVHTYNEATQPTTTAPTTTTVTTKTMPTTTTIKPVTTTTTARPATASTALGSKDEEENVIPFEIPLQKAQPLTLENDYDKTNTGVEFGTFQQSEDYVSFN